MQLDISLAYNAAHRRLFLLDYDGTLADLQPTPPEAKPTAELIQILDKLVNDPRNTVVIISGRDHDTLDEWLGDLPLSFAAEHGMKLKHAGAGWVSPIDVDLSWMPAIQAIMQSYVGTNPGVILETKPSSVAWHNRAALDASKAALAENELVGKLQQYATANGLRVIHGKQVIEVQAAGTNKGEAAKQWLAMSGWDFILAAGDDTTDEDLFKVMPPEALTIKIGQEKSHARLHMASPQEFRLFLANLSLNKS
jgi:trehalose 6-phosphate synthase/phosphatase